MWNPMVGETFYPWPPGTHTTPLCKLGKKTKQQPNPPIPGVN